MHAFISNYLNQNTISHEEKKPSEIKSSLGYHISKETDNEITIVMYVFFHWGLRAWRG